MADWPGAIAFADVWMRAVADRPEQTFLVFEHPPHASPEDTADGTSEATGQHRGESGGRAFEEAGRSSEATGQHRAAEWTYAEFHVKVAQVAHTLRRAGVVPGRAVHVVLTNSPSFVAVWLAAARMGAWIVPSDPMGRAAELAGHIARTRPVVGVCSTARADTYRAAVDEAGADDLHVIVVDEADVDLTPFGERLLADWPTVSLHDRAAVMFTSGTTGLPKGVEVTQANYAFAGKVMAEAAGLQPEDRQLVVLPLFHANAQYYSFASAIWVGASVALMPAFSASRFVEQVRAHGATHASLFAAPMRMILARGITDDTQPVRLRHCWYAQNITDDQHATLTRVLGCAPRQLYGMTETIPAVLTDEADNPVPSSMGFVSPGCEVDVQDADGTSVPPGVVGEVVVRGEPGITLFAGYLDMPEVTAESFRNGWFRTGDRATRDADGRHWFDGRRSDVLKVSGENVSIVEVEAVLASHPGVLEAAVVGRADPIRDEVPVAFVVARDPADPPSVESLQAWCEERLSKPKRPREFTLLDELPRTSVGKIRKFLLADRAASQATGPTDREG
jgi:crotonobetaine/carnitine-CoA ligase